MAGARSPAEARMARPYHANRWLEAAARIAPQRRSSEVPMANQFVVELKNVPGGLASLAEALAARGIDLRTIGGGGIGHTGHIIMTTADDDAARAVLQSGGQPRSPGQAC